MKLRIIIIVVHWYIQACVLPSPSSIVWYWSKGDDALRLEMLPLAWGRVMAACRGVNDQYYLRDKGVNKGRSGGKLPSFCAKGEL